MELTFWKKFISFLLPKSRAWTIVIEKTLSLFIQALAIVPKIVHDHLSGLFLEIFPSTTNYILKWSQQFGFANERTVEQLENEWSQGGGQSPHYLQTILQSNGFENCFVHEWWADTVPTSRNPIPLIDRVNNNLLVNKIQTTGLNYLYQDGDGHQDGDGSQDGSYSGILFTDKKYFAKDDPELYPNYFYVGGETFPDSANIRNDTLLELERLIYKIKPMHLRCVLLVNEQTVIKDTLGASDVLKDTYGDSKVLKDEVG